MRVYFRHEWASWNGIEEELFARIRAAYEYVPEHRMYDGEVFVTWQDVLGCEARGAVVRNIPLVVTSARNYVRICSRIIFQQQFIILIHCTPSQY